MPIRLVTVTSPMVVTVAIRIPATITGMAIGSSTCHSRWKGEYPIPRAASITSGGTVSSPVTMLRIRISSV